ncbi:hypothetical protein Hanom_Chr16g01510731 [Helianthus anomalus]
MAGNSARQLPGTRSLVGEGGKGNSIFAPDCWFFFPQAKSRHHHCHMLNGSDPRHQSTTSPERPYVHPLMSVSENVKLPETRYMLLNCTSTMPIHTKIRHERLDRLAGKVASPAGSRV